MPEKDMSRQTVERAAKTIGMLRHYFQTKVPYGPAREYLTPREARLKLQNIDPKVKEQTRQRMGPEAWESYMRYLYG